MYHISNVYLGKVTTLTPRVPKNAMEGEDKITPRVCFSPTIEQCLLGIHGVKSLDYATTFNAGWFLYATKEELKSAKDKVPDFETTKEHWATSPVSVDFIGVVEFDQKRKLLLVDYSRGYEKELTKETEEFIQKAKMIHGDLYDYSLTSYVRGTNPTYFRCVKHGYVFKQTPNIHLKKAIPCNICKTSEGDSQTTLTLSREYILNKTYLDRIKAAVEEMDCSYIQDYAISSIPGAVSYVYDLLIQVNEKAAFLYDVTIDDQKFLAWTKQELDSHQIKQLQRSHIARLFGIKYLNRNLTLFINKQDNEIQGLKNYIAMIRNNSKEKTSV